MDCADERGRWGDTARRFDELGHVLTVQAAQNDPLEEALAGQFGQRLGERVPA